MAYFIKSSGNVSPQKTYGQLASLDDVVVHEGNLLRCQEPDYKVIIDVKLLRRMSRIIKMGVAAATACLTKAEIAVPDAIVTGTAYGCLDDTGIFLSKMVENNEEMLSPTAFIQSTHNTVGAQIALMLKCHNYNNTFVHRGFSFESALLDAMMLLQENEAQNVLVGGIDEITDISHAILTRMGLYKKNQVNNLELYDANTKGTIGGEGAAFFVLTNQSSGKDEARLDVLSTFYKPTGFEEIKDNINAFLAENDTDISAIDLIILGKNGDVNSDKIYDDLTATVFKDRPTIHFKHLCGEYPTASSFALWLATSQINKSSNLSKVLIYNHYQNIHHSLYLLSKC